MLGFIWIKFKNMRLILVVRSLVRYQGSRIVYGEVTLFFIVLLRKIINLGDFEGGAIRLSNLIMSKFQCRF